MQIKRLLGALSQRRHGYLLPACIAVVLCCGSAAPAQSGRQPPPPPPPPVAVAPDSSELPFRISSVIVSAKIVYEEGHIHSNYVDETIKDCIERLNERPLLTSIKGGNMTREQATERAKKEADAYVLWMEINMKDRNIWGELKVSHIDYYLFRPRTAKIQAEGRVDPNNIVKRIGGAQVPIENRRVVNKRPQRLSTQLWVGAREVADLVRGRF